MFCFDAGLGSAKTGSGGRGGGKRGAAFWGKARACGFGTTTESSAPTSESVTSSGTLGFSWGIEPGGLTALFCGATFGASPSSALGGGTLSALRSGLDLFAGEAVGDDAISGSVTSVTS